jgi:hypothetical protein
MLKEKRIIGKRFWMTTSGYKSVFVINTNDTQTIQGKRNIQFSTLACACDLNKQSCCTFVTDIIIIFTATSTSQLLPLQVRVVLANSKIITDLSLHIVQQQVCSIISLGSWSLVRVHRVVKVVSICRQNTHTASYNNSIKQHQQIHIIL